MIAKIVLGERLGKGCGRELGCGFFGLQITGRDKAVTGKTIGDEPEQIFHKGSRFSRTRCPRSKSNGHAQHQLRNGSPEGSVARAKSGGATAFSIHFGGMVSVKGGGGVSPIAPVFVVSAPLRGSG